MNKKISMSSSTIQADSAQDFSITGTYNPPLECETSDKEVFDFIIVADSHGVYRSRYKNYYTKMFQVLDWGVLLSNREWQQTLKEMTCKFDTQKVGTTITIWKIYADRFECYWIGDSSGKLYSNNELLFQTRDHDYNNQDELIRIQEIGGNYIRDWDISLKDKSTILSVQAKVIDVKGEKINMTRSLGHFGVFLPESFFESAIISREPDVNYKIVTGSDGFWQMTCSEDDEFISLLENKSDSLAQFARTRWESKWNWDDSQGKIETGVKLPASNIDDICVATWSSQIP